MEFKRWFEDILYIIILLQNILPLKPVQEFVIVGHYTKKVWKNFTCVKNLKLWD